MAKLSFPTKFGDGLAHLSVQTNPGNTMGEAISRASHWASDVPGAKSFSIIRFHFTDYHRSPRKTDTGYASFEVQYYSTIGDGEYPVVPFVSTVREIPQFEPWHGPGFPRLKSPGKRRPAGR